jgi:polysaccharide deacetylase family protein (PEP-CTERM system associated)
MASSSAVDPSETIERVPPNLLSFDIEDWSYLITRILGKAPAANPEDVIAQTELVLDLLKRHEVRATFFVLGLVAESAPQLVKRIAQAGHEIASHGHLHLPVFDGTLQEFEEDLSRSKELLESITGRPVLGYRAPAFSVPRENPQGFFDILGKLGFTYDSSIVSTPMPRYGLTNFSEAPVRIETSAGADVVEFPLSLATWGGRKWMVAGGGYWRIFPGWLLSRAVRRVRRDGRPFVNYFHNYEFDPRRLRIPRTGGLNRNDRKREFRDNLFRRSLPKKLDRILTQFPHASFEDVLADYQFDVFTLPSGSGDTNSHEC